MFSDANRLTEDASCDTIPPGATVVHQPPGTPVRTAPTADAGPAPEVEFFVPRMMAGLRFSDAKGLVVDVFVYPGPAGLAAS